MNFFLFLPKHPAQCAKQGVCLQSETVKDRYIEMGYVPQPEIIEKTGLDRKMLLNLRRKGVIKDYKVVESTNYMYALSEFNSYLPQ